MIPPLCDFKFALTVFAAQRVYVFSAVMPLPEKGRQSLAWVTALPHRSPTRFAVAFYVRKGESTKGR